MMNRNDMLNALAKIRKDEIVVYTMSAMKGWLSFSDSPLDLFVAGAMGFASSVGVGLALAQPQRKIWVLDGDGSLLMNLGTLVTIANQAPANLIHFVLENGIYEIPGQIPLPGRWKMSLTSFARAAGLKTIYEYDDLAILKKDLNSLLQENGPVFVDLKVEPGPFGEASPPGSSRRTLQRIIMK